MKIMMDDYSKIESKVTFIEPFPDRLRSLLRPQDLDFVELHQCLVQDIDPSIFSTLSEGDILFIDSSHISKIGSDVNWLIFRILPLLKRGTVIHFHDILFPFEYPREWIFEGRFWNEAYILKAFLMYNSGFEMLLFNDYLAKTQRQFLDEIDPRLSAAGGSLWLRKK